MFSKLPVEVNPYRLIEQRRSLSGYYQLEKMHRLAEVILLGESQMVQVQLDFTESEIGLPMIRGKILGCVWIECQRCLKKLSYDINSDLNIVLVTCDEEAVRIQDSYDTWVIDEERLFLQDFIEDEILLTLPYVAKHEVCEPDIDNTKLNISSGDMHEKTVNQDSSAEENPFAILKDWKKTE